jgi:hypothetical protein
MSDLLILSQVWCAAAFCAPTTLHRMSCLAIAAMWMIGHFYDKAKKAAR